jgi:glycosyltransferase involved in cell wall biosynthesis
MPELRESMPSTPLVSVVTPFYNTAEYLPECIESVLGQTYENWEYTLINNCSTDGSAEIAASYAARFPDKIRVVHTSSFLSQVQNYNFALACISCESKYCKMVQADDLIFPDCIRSMVEAAEANPSAGIVAAYELQGEKVRLDGLPYGRSLFKGRDVCRLYFLKGIYLFGTPTSLLMRSEPVRSRNPFFEERYAPFEDGDACLDVLRTWDFAFVHQVLTYTRLDNGGMSARLWSFGAESFVRLARLVAHGRNYLSQEEYRECLKRAEREYFLPLTKAACALHGESREFWEFHRRGLASFNYSFDWKRLARWLPRAVIEKAWGAFWRKWDQDSGSDLGSGCALQQPRREQSARADSEFAHSRRSHVLFVHTSREFGGAEKHLIDLLRRLSGCGVDLSVLCLNTDFFTERLSENGAVHVSIRRTSYPRGFREWVRVLRDIRPDAVVFVNGVLWQFPWYAPVAAWVARIPRRFSIAHLLPPPVPPRVEGWARRSTARKMKRTKHFFKLRLSAWCSTTICVSDAIREALIRNYHFPSHKTVTIRNGVSLSKFERSGTGGAAVRQSAGIGTGEFLLVSVGRLSEQKAFDILLLAMAQLARHGVHCKCIIVGDGPLRTQLSEQAVALGLSNQVFFAGFQEDVRPYLEAANAFVLASRNEGLPLALLEAMACGLPSVVTNVGGNGEVLTDGDEGLIVPPGSADRVADAISYLVTHPGECAEMSKMARARVREAFDVQRTMAQISQLIVTGLPQGRQSTRQSRAFSAEGRPV